MSRELSQQEAIYIDGLLPYLLHKPKNQEKLLPLLFFLHGAGERGSNLEQLKATGLPAILETQDSKAHDFLIVSPQCSIDETKNINSRKYNRWTSENNLQALEALFEDSLSRYPIDPARIYMTGLSMGGYGTWEFAIRNPNKLAAIAPICGGGTPQKAAALKHLPIWAFHGADDDIVPVSESKTMIQAIRELGGTPKLTIYPDTNHDSWTETYKNDALFECFLNSTI